MFLAIKEMLHEKLRYSLIVALIFLVSYLLIILTGLATGWLCPYNWCKF